MSVRVTSAGGRILHNLARGVLQSYAARPQARFRLPHGHSLPEELRVPCGAFVTLRQAGRLRGCMGSTDDSEALAATVMRSAYNAGFKDPRFQPLQVDELPGLEMTISVLSSFERLAFSDVTHLATLLVAGTDGLLLKWKHLQATFLPEVWQQIPEPAEFLQKLLEKGDIPAAASPPELTAFRYATQSLPAPPS